MRVSLRLFAAVLMLAGTGACSSIPQAYRLEVGARYEAYDERLATDLNTSLSQALGTAVTTTQGDPSHIRAVGYGGQLGITQQLRHFVNRITLFYTKYQTVDYQFQVSGAGQVNESITPSAWGIDASFDYEVSIFRPHLSYKYESFMTQTTVSNPGGASPTTTSSSALGKFYVGGGLTIEVPVYQKIRVVVQADYRVPIQSDGSKTSVLTAQAGFRLFNW